ncbi:MAG: GFA family protein [Pseudomonadota bacterium]
MTLVRHGGGCHCGRVRFQVEAPDFLELDQCNCTICQMSGYLHYVVQADRFLLIKGEQALVRYRFGTQIAEHPFCDRCGVKSFFIPRFFPGGVSVNANCLDGDTITGKRIARHLDGLNWERRLHPGAYQPPSWR